MAAGAKNNSMWNRNLICILVANCLLQMSNSATNTLISTYATFLGAGPKLMGLLTGLFYAVAMAMRPVAGPVQTRADHKRLMIVTFALGAVVNAGYALFHSIPLFVVFRVLHGVQYAFIGSLCMTMTADSLPPEKLASGVGFFGASSSVAQAIAPRIGIFLRAWGTQYGGEDFGYTAMFLFSFGMLLLAQIPCWLVIARPRPRAELAESGEKWYRQILSGPAIAPTMLTLLFLISYSTLTSYMVPFGAELGLKDVGSFFSVLAIGMLAIRTFSGWIADRFGLRNILIPSMVVYVASFLFLGNVRSMTGILIGAALVALGYGTASPLAQALSMQTEPTRRRAVASNTLYVGMDIGLFFGPLIGGFVRDFAGSFRSVILFGCVGCALALLIYLLTWRRCEARIAEVRALEEAERAE